MSLAKIKIDGMRGRSGSGNNLLHSNSLFVLYFMYFVIRNVKCQSMRALMSFFSLQLVSSLKYYLAKCNLYWVDKVQDLKSLMAFCDTSTIICLTCDYRGINLKK